MEQNHDYEKTCERYLLGELSEQEQAQLEEAYFANDARFESFLAVKHDLIDAYARGDLTGAKRQQFEQHFLASGPRRQQVDGAKEFIRAVSALSLNEDIVSETSKSSVRSADAPWWRSMSKYHGVRPLVFRGAVATLLLLMLAGSWILVRHFQRQRVNSEDQRAGQIQQENKAGSAPGAVNENSNDPGQNNNTSIPGANSQSANSTFSRQPGPVNKRSTQPPSGQIASIFLTPFSSRGDSDSNTLLLHPNTEAVRLHLTFKQDGYERYDVVLRTLEGEQVFQRSGLKARSTAEGKLVTFTLDSSTFSRRDYIVTLSGITVNGQRETIAEYYFHVKQNTPPSPKVMHQ